MAEGVEFRGPLDPTRAATAVLDARGRILGWSPRAEELFGHPQHEAVGKYAAELLAVPGDRGADAGDARLLHGGTLEAEHTGELTARRRNGQAVRVAVRAFPLPGGTAAGPPGAAAGGGHGPATVLLAAEAAELRRWETRQALLSALVSQSPIGLTIYDTSLRVMWANATCKRELAGPPEAYVGLPPDELVPGGEILSGEKSSDLRELVEEVLETGDPVVDLHYRGLPQEDPAHERIWSYSYYRLLGPGQEPLGVCEESFDITERYRAQRRLQLLVRAGEHVGTTLDITRTARELADVVIPEVADSVVIDLLREVLQGQEPATSPVRSPEAPRTVRVESRTAPGGVAVPELGPQAGTAEADDAGDAGDAAGTAEAAEAAETAETAGHPDSIVLALQRRSLASGRAVLDNGTDGHPAPGRQTLRTLVVPLRARGPTMGVVTFLRSTNPDPFGSDDLALADELVRRAAFAVDNARRYTSEHTAALTLQRSLLPQRLPPQTAVDTAYRYLPADNRIGVGGDWFDIIPLSGARVGLVIGDVVGHGLRAAATMGRLRSTVRALARLDLTPDELLAHLDDLVTQAEEERVPADGGDEVPADGGEETLGVTCLYAVYDPVSQRCVLARAGHPLPAVVSPGGRVTFPELPSGPPLGTGGLPFESAELELPQDSLLALFTDGLVEARDLDIDAGLDTLGGILAHHRQPLESLCDRIMSVLPSGAATDDAALLLVRTRALSTGQVAVWEMDADPAVVSYARTRATRQLDKWGLGELAFTTELIVSELVTNAIRYAGGPIQLRLIRDRTLICEVSDTGHTSPHLRHAASDDEGGRGLFLVTQTTQRWGTRYTPGGKVIWAEQPLLGGAPQAAPDPPPPTP
ncbi:SpoIIE family protein phosphatase [Streptomyces armeniacus]